MRTKQILAALALPMAFAACSQEELVSVENKDVVDLSNRPLIENLDLVLGANGADTRLGIADGKEYGAAWSEEDKLGACIIDIPTYTTYPTPDEIAAKVNGIEDFYTIKDYISSNFMYLLNGGKWSTQARLVEGNYMFYAPHNDNFVVRTPIEFTLPTIQNVDPAKKSESGVMNSAVEDFYQSGAPVFVGYQFLAAEGQKLTPEVKLYNVYAYPKVTLKNDYKEGQDAKDLVITKIVITKGTKFDVKTAVDNEELKANVNGKDAEWNAKAIETAATAQIMQTASEQESEITVNFGEGLTIKAGTKESFYIVLPAAAYRGTEKLKLDVYTADNKKFAAVFTMKEFAMNPGKRYPSEEYNTTSGTLKETAGTLATVSLKGTLKEVTEKSTGISNNAELINYIAGVAKRFEEIREVTDEFINTNTMDAVTGATDYTKYNETLHFTLADEANIVIDDELIDALIEYLGDKAENAEALNSKLKFLRTSASKIKLGSLTKLDKFQISYDGKVTDKTIGTDPVINYYALEQETSPILDDITVEGDVTLTGNFIGVSGRINVPVGATLTLPKELQAGNIVNSGGKVIYNGATVIGLYNHNSLDSKGEMDINENVATGVMVRNDGVMNVKGGNVNEIVTVTPIISNYGTVNTAGIVSVANKNSDAVVNVTATNGNSSTVIAEGDGSKVYNSNLEDVDVSAISSPATIDVIATLTKVPGKAADKIPAKASINHIIFDTTSELTISEDAFDWLNTTELNTIEFKGNLVTPKDITAANLTIKFNNSAKWGGDAKKTPTISVKKVIVAEGKTVERNYITVTASEGTEGDLK